MASLTRLASSSSESTEGSLYKDSVLLPKTNFNQRANAVVREPEIQAFWDTEGIYEAAFKENTGPTFTLHDGPPYANGDLHIGHALNKILKDFINRYRILTNRKVKFVPGWDCHGLPIELKVLQSMKSSERRELTPLALREKAADFARATVEKQRESFKRYGVWASWDEPYLTLDPKYEAAQIEVFGKMVLNGHIYRGRKPVHWSPSSRTALAEAELEYPEGHTSRSIYVAFKTTSRAPCLEPFPDLHVAIWTTTPWTIPANLAVAVNADLRYSVVRIATSDNDSKLLLVADDLKGSLATQMGADPGSVEVLATFSGQEVAEGTAYQHPLFDRESPVVVGGDYITTESGTGLVHTAPGHGQEDYQTGLKYGLEQLSPVDDAGRFTSEAGEFEGLDVLGDGNAAVIDALSSAGALLHEEAYVHKYPYDWRTKKPTIFRSTAQWFASVDNFRDEAMQAIEDVRWTPEFGKNRIGSMTASRADWCISRQRTWGVPIPVFYHKETGEALMTRETIQHIQDLVALEGSDAWWTHDVADLLPESLRAEAGDWVKGTDTMDVWFDSGSSWAGVVSSRDGLGFPADLYLEGSDQHRGWFQSSLLTAVAAEGRPPYRQVLTHGFVLDEKGTKMSKSVGNVVDPREVIEGGNNKKAKPAYGADVLRLWVSSVDYSSDVCVGDNILKQVFESYRRMRNTARFLLGNLHDFDPATDSVDYEDLTSLDKYILGRYSQVVDEVSQAYESYQFFRASQAVLRFMTSDLSSFYMDIAKDRLYISGATELRRRSCQMVFSIMIEGLAKLLAPILPHMAEDIWLNLPYDTSASSVFRGGWPDRKFPGHREADWETIIQLRDDVNKALEVARQNKLIGSGLESHVILHVEDPDQRRVLEAFLGDPDLRYPPEATNAVDDLRFIFLSSKVSLVDSTDDVHAAAPDCVLAGSEAATGATVGVARAPGVKCERCWMYCSTVGEHDPGICPRCSSAFKEWQQ